MRVQSLAMCTLAFAVLSTACTQSNPLYCSESASCTEGGRPYCDLTGTFQEISNRCIAAPGDAGELCSSDAQCTLPSAPICDQDLRLCRACAVSGEGLSECVARDDANPACSPDGRCVECALGTDCPLTDTPICESETCVACTEDVVGDADCSEREQGFDFCIAGSCSECRGDNDCPSNAPVCDPSDSSCRRCELHNECLSQVCDLQLGECLDELKVIYVGADGADSATCGTKGNPCKTLSAPGEAGNGSAALDKVQGMCNVIRVAVGSYSEAIEVSGQTVVIYGAGPTSRFLPLTDKAGLLVTDKADVTVYDLTFANANGNSEADGVRCESSSVVSLHRVQIHGNDAQGVDVSTCSSTTIDRCKIHDNALGGVVIRDSGFHIVNSFITNNGNVSATTFGGVSIANNGSYSPQVFDFNTVARNQAMAGSASSGVSCAGPLIVVRNNIVWGGLGTVPSVSGNCTWEFSVLEGDNSGSNISVDPGFAASPVDGAFKLKPSSKVEGTADPSATLELDQEGDSRPLGSGYDPGADEIQP